MCEETLLGIQEKPVLSGTLGAPSLQERTEEGPCSEDSVFLPPAATVKTLRGPKGLSKSLSPMFSHNAWPHFLFLYVILHSCRAHSCTKHFAVTLCCNLFFPLFAEVPAWFMIFGTNKESRVVKGGFVLL